MVRSRGGGTQALIRSGKCWNIGAVSVMWRMSAIRTSVILIMRSEARNKSAFYLLKGRQQFIRGLFMFLCLITAMRISISSQRFCKSLGVEAWQLCTVLVVMRIEIDRAGWIKIKFASFNIQQRIVIWKHSGHQDRSECQKVWEEYSYFIFINNGSTQKLRMVGW